MPIRRPRKSRGSRCLRVSVADRRTSADLLEDGQRGQRPARLRRRRSGRGTGRPPSARLVAGGEHRPDRGTARGSVTSARARSAEARLPPPCPASPSTSSSSGLQCWSACFWASASAFSAASSPRSPSGCRPSCTRAASRPPRARVEPDDHRQVGAGLGLQPVLLAPEGQPPVGLGRVRQRSARRALYSASAASARP